MSNSLLFKDHKIFVKSHRIRNEYDILECTNPLSYLQSNVEEISDFTFGDFWNLAVIKNAELLNLIFAQSLGEASLAPYIEEGKKPKNFQENNEPKSDFVQISHVSEIWDWTEDTENKDWGKEFSLLQDFYGGKADRDGSVTIFSLGFTPISEYMGLPLKINKEVNIYVHGKDFDTPEINCGKKEFTLYQIINAIFNEISWYGYPDDRDRKKDELVKSLEEFNDEFDYTK